ncbi:uncharacterized protein N7473_011326 [Penicillium subrubescens]|jgi:hypothetical protein|uniref:Uncharacterized protein n=1 Tax=Penicillium subrubescens TaxID=1316194 RepID=A0A1Q5UNH4_9EURO|nr:uncharacterized protein N7473_011326 [Penicillium subrubescens]KAJ5880273.1 hypothetical protein N7473_011326 [Penicillium subrubescens]OKP14014.1 hypothetical protein PENSUB_283 [Penicillium subrubescens]
MAPVQQIGDFPDIPLKSVEVRDVAQDIPTDASPAITLNYLSPRADSSAAATKINYGQGTVDPKNIKMQGLMALFALIGAAFVLGGIWFFFWAKNGGFVWRKGDWEDYKSTVLRRKGPDGRTLSNATKSTKLGGGSVVGYSDDGYTYTDETGTYTETATTISDEKPQKKKKRNFREKLLRRHKDERWEGEADDDMRAYREERPARIGGMNREADGTYHGSDYDSSAPPTHYNRSDMSEVRDYAYEQPRRSRRRDPSGFSFTAGSEDVLSQTTEEHQLRDPSTRRNNRQRTRERRQSAAPPSAPSSRTSSPRKKDRRSVPGGYTEPLDLASAGTRSEYQYSNVDTEDSNGTRSYHHPIPGLTKGYRRDGHGRRRRDSLSDSDGE